MTRSAHPSDGAANLWLAFAAVAAATPRAPAIVLPEGEIDFAVLMRDAERVAAWFSAQGIRRGDVIAIRLPKRRETYALWLASLRAGCPYVFIDPRNPPARDASVLARVRPALLATAGETANPYGSLLRLDAPEAGVDWLAGLTDDEVPAPAALSGLDPAYVMFTSGSTGEPKGAVIPHQGVLSLMRWAREGVAPPGGSRFSNINPLHFDNSVFDLYGGLINGAAIVPVETAESPNPAHWVARLREGRANVFFAVPTLFQTLQTLKLLTPASLPDARHFLFGGEGFPIAALTAFHERFKGRARLVNVYGPTETSCICASLVIDDAALAAAGEGFVSLGRMHADFAHCILDEDATPVAAGETGELWIGGANVGLGYFSAADETSRRFRQDPRQSDYRSIWYRSGDLVREDEGGLLWFTGRADNQVKIRGHRIELEEIDLAVEALAGVVRAVAVMVKGRDGPEIAVAAVGEGVLVDAVRAQCEARLPVYMRPSRILVADTLPQNANGKTDRKAAALLFQEAP